MSRKKDALKLTEEQKQECLMMGHNMGFSLDHWHWEMLGYSRKRRFHDPSRVNTIVFEDTNLGKVTVFWHACGAYLGLSHENNGEMVYSFKDDNPVYCRLCEVDIPVAFLQFAWMQNKLAKLF